jgi:transcriptional regulator with XRE-family HTH domain
MLAAMPFPDQLATLRRSKGLTQVALAAACGISVPMLQRYEAGTSQPTLDVIKKLAVVLTVPADDLIFEPHERGPSDDLRLQFEAMQRLDPDERQVVKAVLESIIIRHDATAWNRARVPNTPSQEPTSAAG